MTKVRVAHTAALDVATLRDVRALLDEAFAGEFTDEDWHHALGGQHVLISDAEHLLSHASIIERTLTCGGERLHVGYVEAVATTSSARGCGYGTEVMSRVGELIREQHLLGALSTGAHRFYEQLGWTRWRGETFVDNAAAPERTPDDDGTIMVLLTHQTPMIDLDAPIVCDWRPGDVW